VKILLVIGGSRSPLPATTPPTAPGAPDRPKPDRMPADARIAGLVNKAGIAGTGPTECVPLDKLRHLFDVVIVEPGAVAIHTWDKAASAFGRAVPATGRYQTLIAGVQCGIIGHGARHGVPPHTVARVLTARAPATTSAPSPRSRSASPDGGAEAGAGGRRGPSGLSHDH